MKKYIPILCFTLLLSGCSTKSLKCTLKEDIEAGKSIKKQTIIFDDDEIKRVENVISIELNNNYKDYTNTMYKSLKKSLNNYNDKNGIEITSSKEENKFTFVISGDYDKMNDDSKKVMELDDDVTYKKAKSSLTKQGYTCK